MKPQQTEALFEAVEQRILFSADGLGGMAVELADPMPEEPAIEATLHENDALVDQNLTAENDSLLSEQQLRTELVFIDPNVEGYETLMDDLLSNGHDRNFEIHMLDGNGIDDISSALDGVDDVSAVHIIAHGTEGEIQIGNTSITNDSFAEYQSAISSWSESLSEEADILFYGCDVAGSESGQQLLGRIADASGADIAASDDLTGHVDAGGDWVLEYSHGQLETEVAVSEAGQNQFTGVLDIDSGIVAHYDFESDASDVSGNNNDGTLQRGASINSSDATDIVGDAKLSLDGNNDFVDLNSNISSFDNLSQGTIAGWIRTTQNGDGSIFTLSDSSDMEYVKFGIDDGELEWVNLNSTSGDTVGVTNGANLNDGDWHHVAITVGPTGNQFFIDGVSVSANYSDGSSSDTSFLSDVRNADTVNIGKLVVGNRSYHMVDGLLDDVRVYDRALSSSDITELYNHRGVNEAAVMSSVEGSTLSYSENDGAVAVTSALSLVDSDDSDLESAVIQITGNYQSGEDVLGFSDQNGISGSWDASTGTLTLSGTSSVANYQAALRSITYTNNSEDPNTSNRAVSFTVNDGDVDSNTQTRTITVAPVNDAPSGTDNTVSTNEDTDHVFSSGDFGFSDVEGDAFDSVDISTGPSEGTLYVDADNDGVVDAGEALTAGDSVSVSLTSMRVG